MTKTIETETAAHAGRPYFPPTPETVEVCRTSKHEPLYWILEALIRDVGYLTLLVELTRHVSATAQHTYNVEEARRETRAAGLLAILVQRLLR